MHPRTVVRLLSSLEEKGLLQRERRHLSNGNRTSNGYLLVTDPGDQVTNHHVTDEANKVTTVPPTEEPSVEPSVPRTQRATRQTQMPSDLSWTNAHALKALARHVDVEVEFEKFKNHHLAKANRFADWDKAFHSWLDRSRPEPGFGAPTRGERTPPRTPADRMNAVLAIQDPNQMGMIE